MAERRKSERGEQQGQKQQASSRGGSSQRRDASGRGSERSDSSDLKEREYRDEQGNVHHHTREYMERHGKQGGGSSERS